MLDIILKPGTNPLDINRFRSYILEIYIYLYLGPVDGGTEITIEGSNLATTLQQVQGNIYLDNIPCAVIDYQVSTVLIFIHFFVVIIL